MAGHGVDDVFVERHARVLDQHGYLDWRRDGVEDGFGLVEVRFAYLGLAQCVYGIGKVVAGPVALARCGGYQRCADGGGHCEC